MNNISGKTILITGASKGIGKAIALSLAGFNTNLGLVARSKKELEDLQSTIIKLGSKAEIFIGSVADEPFVNAAIQLMLQKFGKIDVLINNAGYGVLIMQKILPQQTGMNYLPPTPKEHFFFARQ